MACILMKILNGMWKVDISEWRVQGRSDELDSDDMLYDLLVVRADIATITENEGGLMMLTKSTWITMTDGAGLLLLNRSKTTKVGRDMLKIYVEMKKKGQIILYFLS